ncbi:mechanosensitive ion channel family protein [Planctomonas psychrotolerans]|uniref:mechanosensitive ion channel family protein n=1 Tax=Planctomonas psychrotolerans TaxID=2528712 RepID=UPI00123BA346|nr:mechanosensitive ion channel domain-containing protein [Planctomonas psychrotolerans]
MLRAEQTPIPENPVAPVVNAFETPFVGPLIGVVLIIVIAVVVRFLMQFIIRRVVDKIVNGVKKRQNVEDTQAIASSPLAAVRVVQRTRTLGSVLSNIVTVVIAVIAILLVLTTVNPDVLGSLALLTAALGAGLGFGAQNIIKDVLNGLFMVVEDQLGVGDIIDTGFATGVVEAVGIRVTQIRDVNGTLWFVRNGEILRVGNMSQGWARVIIDLPVPYTSNVDLVQENLLATATELATSSEWRSRVLEKPEIWGIESISAEALVIRLVMKTRASAQYDVARELRLRLKRGLDFLGVTLPPLNRVVMDGLNRKDGPQPESSKRTRPADDTTPSDRK